MSGLLGRLMAIASRISTQMYVTVGVLAALTITAITVAWLSFDSIDDAQERVNTESLPRIVTAFRITELSGDLVAAAPLLTVTESPEELAATSADIVETRGEFRRELDRFEQQKVDAALFVSIRNRGRRLESNIARIEAEMPTAFELAARNEALRVELTEIRQELEEILVPALDEQLFYQITGYRLLGEPPAAREEHFNEAEFLRYRHLLALQADTAIATQLLASAFTVSNASLIEPLRESFESVADRIRISAGAIGSIERRDLLLSTLDDLFTLGLGADSGFVLTSEQLSLAERQRRLLEENRTEAVELAADVQELIDAIQTDARSATGASSQAISTSRVLLVVIAGICLAVAISVIWGFVGRVLLRRLNQLSDRMRRMADGDLEGEVIIAGRDEVTEMAAALEVFRRHATEVQRLNLVEKLAEELAEKNTELEKVLDDLHRAQDQIIMREKLAALGEVTTGAAHEIRNPLNFVKNFSEVSAELIEELREVLDDAGHIPTEDHREQILGIAENLTENLERIRSHSDRANAIVRDMLRMGRATDDWQLTDVNRLIEEHAKLAFHSARAADPDFRLNLEFDLDPEVGELEAVPQDLGRVFINMIGNSCDAADARRRERLEPGETESYTPMVRVTSRRLEDSIEITIRDNGTGIPPEVADKIFNPFFTTKPTDRGTGLGLSISNDIVREHGGDIRVDSVPGRSTEMIITLPIRRTEVPAQVRAPTEPTGA